MIVRQAVFFILSLVTTHIAYACSCFTPSAQMALSEVDIVFRGKLVAHLPGQAVFRVEERWKGNLGRYVTVDWRRGDRGDCDGFWPSDLRVGNDLVVFAERSFLGSYRTSICLPTSRVDRAKRTLEDLGTGEPPRSVNFAMVTAGLTFLVLTLAAALFVRQLQRGFQQRSP